MVKSDYSTDLRHFVFVGVFRTNLHAHCKSIVLLKLNLVAKVILSLASGWEIILFDSINSLQGVFIFLVLICKPRMRTIVKVKGNDDIQIRYSLV